MITTWGPGSLIDLPTTLRDRRRARYRWPKIDKLEQIDEPRLTRKITLLTGVPNPRLYAPPARHGLRLVSRQSRSASTGSRNGWSSRKTPRTATRRRSAGWCTATRSTRKAASRAAGRSDPLRAGLPARPRRGPRLAQPRTRWRRYLPPAAVAASSAAPAATSPTCACAATAASSRGHARGGRLEPQGLGQLPRPAALARSGRARPCGQPSRLLIRTATNAHFPQVLSALSLPEQGSQVEAAVQGAVGDPQSESTDRAAVAAEANCATGRRGARRIQRRQTCSAAIDEA